MPELPEVETIRLGLEKYLVGHKIFDIKVNTPNIFTGSKNEIVNQKVISIRRFAKVLSKTKTAIKVVIMDQARIGGIGNIYANDALLLDKIHPQKPANLLTQKEQTALFESIIKVLTKGLESGGASELSFVHADGSDGGYQKFFVVYGKQGQLCPICGKEKIVKIVVGGRGTYFCPHCQKI